ncbi:hypothetical protein V9T40_014702 [Parthenolecanium corni]|uniref:Uncharacterized protein n=1 Tax=Parthenolecanium corni TaxID=536013 RepID=A0AAN9XY32_9HEMI
MTASSKPVKEKLTIAQWFERNGFPGMTPKSFKHHYSFFNKSGLILPCTAPIYRKEGDPDDDSYALPEY